MGFGSYDESEQRHQTVNTDDAADEGVRVNENDYDGRLTFESGASTDDLIETLEGIKAASEDDQ